MADLMVSGIQPGMMDIMATGNVTAQSKDAEPVFASLLCNLDITPTQPQVKDVAVQKTDASNQSLTTDTFKKQVVKEQATPTEDNITPESAEKLQQYNDKIKEAVMEEYDLTEEELDEAMSALGLTYIQLLIPENLVALSIQVTDAENTLDLLGNEGFNELFQLMQNMTMELTAEVNLTPEMLDEFAGMLANDSELPNSEQELIPTMNDDTLNNLDDYVDSTNVPDNESEVEAIDGLATKLEEVVTRGIENGTVEVHITKEQAADENQESGKVDVQDQSINLNGVAGDVEETTDEESSNSQSESFNGKHAQTSNSKQHTEVETNTSAPVSSFSRFAEITQEMSMESAQNLSQVDTESIIRQINDYMKLNINGLDASLEMQLNPASLGKIGLSVSLRDGVVTAQLAVQNEAVRAALESQMVVLRENMNNQGLKVDAVEVTIASHEFEQNLENNFTKQNQENPDQAQKQSRRSILASDITSMEDLSQDDQLAAKMMVENGNRMDISA